MESRRTQGFISAVLLGVALILGAQVAAAQTYNYTLPFGKSRVDPGKLPKPVGIGFTLYEQTQDYNLDSLSFNVPGLVVDPGSLTIGNKLQEANVKLDLWLFPFLNVFGIFGQLEGKTRVDFRGANLPIPLSNLTIDYDGEVYGGGITLAGGTDRYFGSVTAILTETNLSGDFNSKVTALVVTPKVGLIGSRGAFWIGTMYQKAEESHSGTIAVPFIGAVDFDVVLAEKDAWNFLLGMSGALTEHLNLELEGGVGGREMATLALTWRF